MHEGRLFTTEGTLHRLLQKIGCKRGLRLVRHVFLAAESTTVRDELDAHRGLRNTEHGRDLIAIVPDALAARIHLEGSSGLRDRERGFGLEVRVLDALRLEDLVHLVRRARERVVDVTPKVARTRQHVAVQSPDGVVFVIDRRYRVG